MAKTYKLKTSTPEKKDFKLPYSELLNPSQLEAVINFDGPMLCIAGAGSGKTRTLIYRVARMIESGIFPENILLLTFTRKAARNMLERVAELIGENGKKVAGGTYHSFANLMLRKYGKHINLPANFSILDEGDSGDIINLIRADMGLNKKETRFPNKKTLLQIKSKSINQEKPIDEILLTDYSHFEEHLSDIKKLFATFEEYKKENYLLTYDDLLIKLHELLANCHEAKEKVCRQYSYVMADEYQDTNGLQAKITLLLGGEKQNIMVVGDDAQSIYSFRGAKVKNIIEFPRLFENCKIIKLEENYRSTSSILTATNTLMKKAKEGFKKNLFTKRHKGELPAKIRCEDDSEQAAFVASRILDLREEGIPLNQIAVLFRSSYHSYQLELELKHRNIPYTKWGGFKFLESSHLKDVIAHLRVIQNPFDQVSWLRILLLLPGIGTKSASAIYKKIRVSENPFDLTTIKARPKSAEALKLLGEMLQKASPKIDLAPGRLLEIVTDYYFPLLKQAFDDYPRRMKDIDQLAIICQRFANLTDFLAEVSLEPPKDSIEDVIAIDSEDEENIILSTIHSSKGLEWHSVFIIWALEGKFPSFMSMKSEAEIEEERRLMYVAMTRAKENLAISYPGSIWDPVSGSFLCKPSRFIEEVGEDNLETWNLSR